MIELIGSVEAFHQLVNFIVATSTGNSICTNNEIVASGGKDKVLDHNAGIEAWGKALRSLAVDVVVLNC